MNWIVNLALGWLKDYVVRNWRTTLIGVVGALCSQIPALAEHKEQILAATLALVALFSKDGSITGTTKQPALPAPGTPGVTVGGSDNGG